MVPSSATLAHVSVSSDHASAFMLAERAKKDPVLELTDQAVALDDVPLSGPGSVDDVLALEVSTMSWHQTLDGGWRTRGIAEGASTRPRPEPPWMLGSRRCRLPSAVRFCVVGVAASTWIGCAGPCLPFETPEPFRGPLPAGQVAAPAEKAGEGICEVAPDTPQCSQVPRRKPRCNASDPKCGPQRMGEAPRHTCYRGSAQRKPVVSPSVLASRPVDCAYDGECLILGCHRNWCGSWRTNPEITCDLVGYVYSGDAVDDTWCGCVAGRCATFTQ
jgi:hypothetical protein